MPIISFLTFTSQLAVCWVCVGEARESQRCSLSLGPRVGGEPQGQQNPLTGNAAGIPFRSLNAPLPVGRWPPRGVGGVLGQTEHAPAPPAAAACESRGGREDGPGSEAQSGAAFADRGGAPAAGTGATATGAWGAQAGHTGGLLERRTVLVTGVSQRGLWEPQVGRLVP